MVKTMINKRNYVQEILLGTYILCYFIINLFILTDFPFVHSDESWLSGLTRNMVEKGNLGVTETFYDLKPRYPHAIKTIFHIMQMPIMIIFKYDIFSFRLLSLFMGCISLILFYILLKALFSRNNTAKSRIYPIIGTMLLSLDIQFIYASHFARQEIILVFCIIFCIYALRESNYILAGIITGLSIGIHPNSFLIAAMCGGMLIPICFKNLSKGRKVNYCSDIALKLENWKPLVHYTFIVTAFAAAFIALSLFMDPAFINHYIQYGNSEFDIGAPVTNKLAEFPYFIQKIWYGVSGTYYVPNIKLELALFSTTLITTILLLFFGRFSNRKELILILKGLMGMLIGMVIIGRYNQTSIVFIFPLFFLLILLMVDSIFNMINPRKYLWRNLTIVFLMCILAFTSFFNIKPWLAYSYYDYLDEISKVINPNEKVLGNLNSEYYFENEKLLDYRNLSYLKEEQLSVEEYINKNQIKYIIISDELDLIYSQRPIWNMIYGNLRYLEELLEYTNEKCVLVHSFQNNIYGVRIVQYMKSDKDFTIKIFKVKDTT